MAEQDLINERLKKLEAFRKAGENPYPSVSHRTAAAADVVVGDTMVVIAGRVRGKRGQGGVMFLDIFDESGKIQSVAREDKCADYALFRDNVDIGDFVEVSGAVFMTERGEKSIDTKAIRLLAKSIRPLPDQWSGLQDVEIRLRKRYLDMLANPAARDIFIKKAAFWDAFRGILKKAGFLEVDMPALELVAGGADAEPFITHHNALDTDFNLRISLELPLKKMLVGGFERVFEIGRVFRNEGIDREHLQDYIQCEFYAAYWDYKDMMKFVEKAYKAVIKKTTGGLTTQWQGQVIEWGGKWPKIDYVKIFKEKTGLDVLDAPMHELLETGKKFSAKVWSEMGRGRLIDAVYKKAVRPTLIQPCFLINHPLELSPLAKWSVKNLPRVRLGSTGSASSAQRDGSRRVAGKAGGRDTAERVQIVACASEIGNGFSELNDPIDQRGRFEEQMRLRAAGDHEAQKMDEEFVEALEYGMPPAAGFGFSERVFAILMDKPVRETVVFPLMRPQR